MMKYFVKQSYVFQIYTARRNMLAHQTKNRALQPEYAILNPKEYQKKNTPKEGGRQYEIVICAL